MDRQNRLHRAASNKSSAWKRPTERPRAEFQAHRSNTLPVHLEVVEDDQPARPDFQFVEPANQKHDRRFMGNERPLNGDRDFQRPSRLPKSHTVPILAKHESGRRRTSRSFLDPVHIKPQTPRAEIDRRADLQPYAESVESSVDEKNAEQARGSRASSDAKVEWSQKSQGASEGSEVSVRRNYSAEKQSNSSGSLSRPGTISLASSAANEVEMRDRLKRAGFSEIQTEELLAADRKREKELHTLQRRNEREETRELRSARPHHAKIRRDQLSLDTLRYYEIPYHYDRHDPDYIIVLREMDRYEAEILFEHTRRLREGKLRNLHGTGKILKGNVRQHTPVDDQNYDLPITSLLRDSEDDKRRDWATREASKRFSSRPDYKMPMRSDKCMKSVDHSAYADGESSEERAIEINEHSESPHEFDGVFARRHLHFNELNFNDFRAGILELFEPESPQRARILLHLEKVQRDFVKFPAVGNGSPPQIMPYSLRKTEVEDGFEMFSCCIDFFHARQYGKLRDPSHSAQRPQTLLQSHYPGADKQQDLRQVICQVDKGKDRCLHISHLWAMIINEELLVTASILSEAELFSVGQFKTTTSPQPLVRTANTPGQKGPHIQVRNPTIDAMWLLDRAQCQTWFEFALHFEESQWALDNGTILTHKGHPVLPSHWPKLLKATSSSILKLEIDRSDEEVDENATKSRQKDVEHRLQVDMNSARPLGAAIAASFTPPTQGASSPVKLPRPGDVTNGLPDPETMLRYENDKILYRSCHSISFEDLLVALARPTAPSKSVGANGSDANGSDANGSDANGSDANGSDANGSDANGSDANGPEAAGSDARHSDAHHSDAHHSNAHDSGSTARKAVQAWVDGVESAPSDTMGTVVEEDGSCPPEQENTRFAASIVQEGYKSAAAAERPCTHTQSGRNSAAEGAAEAAALNDGSSDTQEASAPANLHHGTSVDGERRTRSSRPQRSVGNRGSSDISREPIRAIKLNQEQRFLAEGARALIYVFLDDHKQSSLNPEARKLCGALDKFIKRLDNSLSVSRTQERAAISNKEWLERTFEDLLGLMNIARVLQGDQFGVCTLKSALGNSMLESFDVALRSASFAVMFANVPPSKLYSKQSASYWAEEAEKSLRFTFYGTMQALQKPPLKSKSAARPKDILCHIVRGIAGRVMPDGRNVYELYNLHIRKLEHEIRAEKPSRSSIRKLRHLRHELEAMCEQVDQQQEDMEEFFEQLVSDKVEIRNANKRIFAPDSLEMESGPGYTLESLRNIIEEASLRCDDFERLKRWTETLLEEAKGQADDINDWRNNAVVIFTIVTIIFLPLSFVASVFGMNTMDIRDMGQGQWVYWASALPLTALVVALTVYWSELVTVERLFGLGGKEYGAGRR